MFLQNIIAYLSCGLYSKQNTGKDTVVGIKTTDKRGFKRGFVICCIHFNAFMS